MLVGPTYLKTTQSSQACTNWCRIVVAALYFFAWQRRCYDNLNFVKVVCSSSSLATTGELVFALNAQCVLGFRFMSLLGLYKELTALVARH